VNNLGNDGAHKAGGLGRYGATMLELEPLEMLFRGVRFV